MNRRYNFLYCLLFSICYNFAMLEKKSIKQISLGYDTIKIVAYERDFLYIAKRTDTTTNQVEYFQGIVEPQYTENGLFYGMPRKIRIITVEKFLNIEKEYQEQNN